MSHAEFEQMARWREADRRRRQPVDASESETETTHPSDLTRAAILAAKRAQIAEGPRSTSLVRRLQTNDTALIRARRFYGLVPWPADLLAGRSAGPGRDERPA